MKNKIVSVLLFFAIHSNMEGQLKSELIDYVLKSRSDYIADSIPDIFRWYYERFTQAGDKPVFDTLKFYDILKTVLLEASFPENNFFWYEYISDTFGDKYAILYTDNLTVYFNRSYIARWDRASPMDDSVIYKVERHNRLEKSLIEPFYIDFDEWNENVTNRSYLYWDGAGGGFILCSKVIFNSGQMELTHTAFRRYQKKCPLFYLKEHLEDGYIPRLQVNCNWITEDRLEEVVGIIVVQI